MPRNEVMVEGVKIGCGSCTHNLSYFCSSTPVHVITAELIIHCHAIFILLGRIDDNLSVLLGIPGSPAV